MRSNATLSKLLACSMICVGAATLVSAASAQSQSKETPGERIARRGDVKNLPAPLKARIVDLANRPTTTVPNTVFSEADTPSQLFQYYLLDTKHFQPNVFTDIIPGINDGTRPTATGANRQRSTIGAVRVVLEPKPDKPRDPNDVRAVIDVFTDVSGLFVINNESGWYEGWMIHDLKVPPVALPRPSGRAQYGTITAEDAAAIAAIGAHNNIPGNLFTGDGNTPRFGSLDDVFPDPSRQPNIVPFPVSIGAFNAQQQSDIHAYWEFNPGTNWVFPHYELPFTGGVPGTFAAGLQYNLQSVIPGSGPSGISTDKLVYGDNPDNPRDADRAEVSDPKDPDRPTPPNPAHLEVRNRFIPSGLTDEVIQDVFSRVKSFEPTVSDVGQRLFDAYAYEVSLIDQNNDGVVSFLEADVNGTSDNSPNTRLYLPATSFDRFAITREINDGLLAPRFAPSQRGYVMSGFLKLVSPAVLASVPQDNDNR